MNNTIIRIEIEGLKHSVATMLSDRNEEINKMIIEEMDRQVNEEWIQSCIQKEVRSALKRAVEGIADNYRVVSAIQEVMGQAIADKISGKSGGCS